ncbi:MAG: DUF559 domain-containing protein, partial [Acidaminococcaceae bacterium]|nr:DUF559 domain-containing protein [Acidaminococcaceae bacterium]
GHDFSDKRIHTNKKYWDNKIRRNMERDLDQTIMLRDEGWIVLRFWESEIKSDVSDCVDKIVKVITGK